MHSVEFTFLYGDMKTELKEMPSLPQLLASTEKTVRKLECISLYSLTDRREFDLELYEESIFKELTESMRSISAVRSSK